MNTKDAVIELPKEMDRFQSEGCNVIGVIPIILKINNPVIFTVDGKDRAVAVPISMYRLQQLSMNNVATLFQRAAIVAPTENMQELQGDLNLPAVLTEQRLTQPFIVAKDDESKIVVLSPEGFVAFVSTQVMVL